MKKLAITLFGISSVLGASAFAATDVDTQPEATAQAQAAAPAQASANYQCAQGEEVTVSYAIDQSGVPTQAAFEAEGDTKQLQLDPTQSNNEKVTFNSEDGYTLSASVPSQNSGFAQSVNITSPDKAVDFQDCKAVSQG